jgi:hypothetical protein
VRTSATFLTSALLGALLVLLVIAGPARAEPSVLFALDASRGTLVPASKAGQYELTLHGVSSPALFFQNRPGNEQGLISVPVMFRRLFAGGQSAPNAVINAVDRHGRQALMGVKLSPPRYDVRRHVLRVRVARLVQGAGAVRAGGRTDVLLPRRFGDTAMFIDDCCARAALVSVFNPTQSTQAVQVNGGATFSIAPAGAYNGWAPYAASTPPAYSPSGGAGPGVLAPGDNFVRVSSPAGGTVEFIVRIPTGVAFISLQLYLFTTPAGGTWILANNGAFVATGIAINGSAG